MLEVQVELIKVVGELHEVQKETNNRISNLRQQQNVVGSRVQALHAGVNDLAASPAPSSLPSVPTPKDSPPAWASAGTAAVGLSLIFVVDQAWIQLYGVHIPQWLFLVLLATLGVQALLALLPRWWVTPVSKIEEGEAK